MVGGVTQPSANRIPDTPLLRYFRKAPFTGPKGKAWGEDRIAEAQRLLRHPGRLAELFDTSANLVEDGYRNYQPFYPQKHVFGAAKGRNHGDLLSATVDIAARLSRRDVWDVPDNPELSFRYLD